MKKILLPWERAGNAYVRRNSSNRCIVRVTSNYPEPGWFWFAHEGEGVEDTLKETKESADSFLSEDYVLLNDKRLALMV
jgi:hypothetical protein